ncbi:MAG: hypothetical protein ACE5DI_04165 [Candidatus Micrarchaeia archaeon]
MDNSKKAQISLEFFFAMSLALLVFFWMANFMRVFYDNSQSSSVVQARLAARDFAMVANRACVSEGELLYKVPCVLAGGKNVPYFIEPASPSNSIELSFSNQFGVARAFSQCNLDTVAVQGLFLSCDTRNYSAGSSVCLSENAGVVSISFGEC